MRQAFTVRVPGVVISRRERAERQGPFTDTLGGRFRGVRRGQPNGRTCFCVHCREKARQAGIDVKRAVRGFEPGVNLSREYCDMKLENLSIVGETSGKLGLET